MSNFISASSHIGKNVHLGDNVHIGNNVTIYDNVTIGDNVYIWDNVVIGKIPMGVSTNYRELPQTLFEKEPIIIGNNCVIACNAIIYRGANIGDNCLISENSIIREGCVLEGDNIIGGCVLVQYDVRMGRGTRVLNNSVISSKSILGDNNFISFNFVTVSDKNFGDKGYDNNVHGPIIGNNNHIGPGVTILSNVTIGDNNTIGAAALITKDIGNDGIFFGSPAKLIKNKVCSQ